MLSSEFKDQLSVLNVRVKTFIGLKKRKTISTGTEDDKGAGVMRMINSNDGLINESRAQVYHNMLGIEKADNGEYEDAINEFTKALSQNPNDANAYFSRATLKVRIGDIEGARRDFKMSEKCHHENKLDLEEYPLL